MGEEISLVDMRPGEIVEIPASMQIEGRENVGIYAGATGTTGSNFFPFFELPHPQVKDTFIRHSLRAVTPGQKFKRAAEATVARMHGAVMESARKSHLYVAPISLTSGCDPEIFVTRGDGTLYPAWEFLQSEDDAKTTVKWGRPPVFWDGFQAEWCPTQKNCLQEMMDSVRFGMCDILEAARLGDPKAKLTIQSSMEASKDVLEKADHNVVAFRCTPSYNVYQDPGTEKPDARAYPYRFAGGHIHAGLGKTSDAVITEIVKALDAIVGVAGVSLAAGLDTPLRRTMYGRAGEFRLPEHGIEYRVLSNFWLCAPPIAHLVFELVRSTVRYAHEGMFNLTWVADQDQVREVVNNCDVVGARKMLEANKHVLQGLLATRWQDKNFKHFAPERMKHLHSTDSIVGVAIETLLHGVETVIPDPTAVETNWHLTDRQWEAFGQHKGGLWRNVR